MPLDQKALQKEVEARRLKRGEKRAARLDAIETQRLSDEIQMDDAASAAGLVLGVDAKMVFAENTGKGVLVKRPTQGPYQLFTQKVLADKCFPADRLDFAKYVVAWPEYKVFVAMLDETPGLVLKVCEVGGNLARAEEAEIEGK